MVYSRPIFDFIVILDSTNNILNSSQTSQELHMPYRDFIFLSKHKVNNY